MNINDFYGATSKGVRDENQDNFLIKNNKYGYLISAVADGMGGHAGGKYASTLVIKLIDYLFEDVDFSKYSSSQIETLMLNNISKIQNYLIDQVKEKKLPKDMGTTLNLNIFVDNNLFTLNIGDSRASNFINKDTFQISEDHNLSTLAKNNPNFARFKNYSNYLTSALGPKKSSKIDVFITELEKKGIIFLTTDGVHNFVDKVSFIKILKNKKLLLKQKVETVLELAFSNKSNDNMTCIMIEYEYGNN